MPIVCNLASFGQYSSILHQIYAMCRIYYSAYGTQRISQRTMQEYYHSRSQFASAPHCPHSNALLAIHRLNIMISLRIIFFMAPPARKKGFAKLVVFFQTKSVRFAQYRRAVARQYWHFSYWKKKRCRP